MSPAGQQQVEPALPAAQVTEEPVRIDSQALKDGRNVIRDLAALVGMDGPPAPVHQLQVVIQGEGQAGIIITGTRKREQLGNGPFERLRRFSRVFHVWG